MEWAESKNGNHLEIEKTIKRNAQGEEVREIQTDRTFSNACERKIRSFPQNE
jgi:hypothetical protein